MQIIAKPFVAWNAESLLIKTLQELIQTIKNLQLEVQGQVIIKRNSLITILRRYNKSNLVGLLDSSRSVGFMFGLDLLELI